MSVVFWKELADHFSSRRFMILLLLIVLIGIGLTAVFAANVAYLIYRRRWWKAGAWVAVVVMLCLAIGALAVPPSDPTKLYVGTGEFNGCADCFFGAGLYRIDNVNTSPTLVGPREKILQAAGAKAQAERLYAEKSFQNFASIGTHSSLPLEMSSSSSSSFAVYS